VLILCGYLIRLHLEQPTMLLTLLAARQDQPRVSLLREVHQSSPGLASSSYRDSAGNRCTRMNAPAGTLELWGDSLVISDDAPDPICSGAREVPVADLPVSCLIYLLGSRYCETDRLSQFAWDRFGATRPGWARVQAICDFVHDHVKFGYGHASSTRTAQDTLDQGVGVCRDYAHLAIALCRCLNIPARYVNGHLGDIGVPVVDPMDFSAWMEVYLEGSWHAFDPRNNMRRIGRIVVARGRDAADVPLIHSFGPHQLQQFQVWTLEEPSAPKSIGEYSKQNAGATSRHGQIDLGLLRSTT
jgi:transglutaminase-like putative cysteine protease